MAQASKKANPRTSMRKTGQVQKKPSRKAGNRTYRSDAFAAIHEVADGLHRVGLIDNTTMREFNDACLTPIANLSPQNIRKIRTKAAISQAVFAAHLNVTTGVVSKWERGEKKPRGPAAKLLSLAAKHGLAAIA